jgi:hypothetical protein
MTLRKVLENDKPKFCKCGHKADRHIGQWYKKRECELCECDYYLRSDRPTKSDWGLAVFDLVLLTFIVGFAITTPTDILNSLPLMVKITLYVGIIFLVWISFALFRQNIRMSKRKEFVI